MAHRGLARKLKKNCLVGLTKTTVEQSTSGFKFKHGMSMNTKRQILICGIRCLSI